MSYSVKLDTLNFEDEDFQIYLRSTDISAVKLSTMENGITEYQYTSKFRTPLLFLILLWFSQDSEDFRFLARQIQKSN